MTVSTSENKAEFLSTTTKPTTVHPCKNLVDDTTSVYLSPSPSLPPSLSVRPPRSHSQYVHRECNYTRTSLPRGPNVGFFQSLDPRISSWGVCCRWGLSFRLLALAGVSCGIVCSRRVPFFCRRTRSESRSLVSVRKRPELVLGAARRLLTDGGRVLWLWSLWCNTPSHSMHQHAHIHTIRIFSIRDPWKQEKTCSLIGQSL